LRPARKYNDINKPNNR